MAKKDRRTAQAAELRRKAEAKLFERKKEEVAAAAAEADIQSRPGTGTTPPRAETGTTPRIVHELEVHQIQLEMQNEELVQVRVELEAALRHYTDLYDLAPVGYFTLARDGTIFQVNLAGANLLGVDVDKLIKRRFGVFVSGQSRTIFNAFLSNVFNSGSKEACEIALLKEGSGLVSAHIEAICDVSREPNEACHAVASDITLRKQAEEELRYLSTHDALTGLYARGFFMEEMARLERGREFPISIVMADVDHLKETNDQEGHSAGDALLKRVAQVLTAAFRADDVVARIGGDEFAVLLPTTDTTVANVSLQRVREMIRQDNAGSPGTLIRLSLGVGTAENSAPLSAVLKEADANMYRYKRGESDT